MPYIERSISALPEPLKELENQRWIVGQAADLLDREWIKSKQVGYATEFLIQITDEINQLEDLPDVFKTEGNIIAGRRLPSFKEAIIETTKRLKFLYQLTHCIPESVDSLICGGSMSYGRFYNVRGEPDCSDIDLFYVVNSSFFQRPDLENAFPNTLGFRKEELEAFFKRAANFPKLLNEGKISMMSQKFQTGEFTTSIKILPFQIFESEFNSEVQATIQDCRDIVKPILDYKQGPYAMRTFTQYNFLGEPFTFYIPEELLDDGAAITTIPSIIFMNGHFYTGDHHNHVIPKFEVEFDRNGSVTQVLNQFQNILIAKSQAERQSSKNLQIEVMNVFDRKDVLSPQVLEEARKRFL